MLLILLYIMTAAWLGYGVALIARERRLARHGLTLTASVKGNETSDGHFFRPIIGYTLDGKYYETTCSYIDKTKFDVGAPMEIRVLREKPMKPERAGTSMRRTYVFSLLIGAFSLAASVYLTLSL